MRIHNLLTIEAWECSGGASGPCCVCKNPADVYYDDGRPLCDDCLIDAVSEDAIWQCDEDMPRP